MKVDTLTFESLARRHMIADPDRQQAGLRAWASGLDGDSAQPQDEDYSSLTEISKAVHLHYSWLWKLQVPERCGERLAGRLRYRKSRVIVYLQSQECRARINELHTERKRHEAFQKGAA